MRIISRTLLQKIRRRLRRLYGDQVVELEERFLQLVGRYGVGLNPTEASNWSRKDVYLITYADMVQGEEGTPLQNLHKFCSKHLKGAVNTVHLLPFYPWSSDDGFSVIDYRAVDAPNGTWKDVEALSGDFNLMFDLVLNHCSARSGWFRDFLTGIAPGRHYFIEADPKEDYSKVVRPRTSPLLTTTQTREGETHVWTTFSPDQVDLNWKNPDVLFEFLDILLGYIAKGAKVIRLDAVAFLWKEAGTDCLHRPETHEMVKLLRDVLQMVAPDVLIISETNVPHEENISYFGKGDEAHMVYNFSLPPLLLHAMLTANTGYLVQWAQNLSVPPKGCTYFNFTASHDGIGVRPLQGLLPEKELKGVIKEVEKRKGLVSYKNNPDGSKSPYELNITYFDAISLPGQEDESVRRFVCTQAVMLAFRGIPGVYFHSLTGTPNYLEGVKQTGHNRTINRRKYGLSELEELLNEAEHPQARVFRKMTQMLRRRANHPAFHPDGGQRVHDFGPGLLVFTRTSPDENETIHCLFNFTGETKTVYNPQSTELLKRTRQFYDILSAKTLSSGKKGLTLQPWQALWLTPRA